MVTANLSGITDWIKEGIDKFKEAIGIGAPKPITEGTALIEAQKLLQYAQTKPIKMGDKGDIVATLQFLLNILGYKTYTGVVPDGIFGPMTYNAVVEYQRSRGLKPDGVVGRLTAFRIYQEIAERTKTARLLPTATQNIINRKIYEEMKELERKYPGVITTSEKEGVVLSPKEKGGFFEMISPEVKKYLIAGFIILTAYLLSRKT